MKKHSFWRENALYGIGNLSTALIWIAIGALYDISPEFVFYVTAFLLLETAGVLGWKLVRFREDAEQAALLQDDSAADRLSYNALREKEDFFTLWAHQIKTPIAAMNLLLQNEAPEGSCCRQELFQIENYVELALNYTRFENLSGDLLLEQLPLEPMVKQVVRKYSTVFIHKHLRITLEQLDCTVLTDEKWFCFVLEQILSNALKYTKAGGVRISTVRNESGAELLVEDSGIGIAPEDLPRIFEKGYTGCNGRTDKRASGLGLYLCKGVCEKLGHSLRVRSQPGCGTRVFLGLPEARQQTDLTKL